MAKTISELIETRRGLICRIISIREANHHLAKVRLKMIEIKMKEGQLSLVDVLMDEMDKELILSEASLQDIDEDLKMAPVNYAKRELNL